MRSRSNTSTSHALADLSAAARFTSFRISGNNASGICDAELFPEDAGPDADCGRLPCIFVPTDEIPSYRDLDNPLNFLLMLEDELEEGEEESMPDSGDIPEDDFDTETQADEEVAEYDTVEHDARCGPQREAIRRFMRKDTRHAKPAHLHRYHTGESHPIVTTRRDRADRSSGRRRSRGIFEPLGHCGTIRPGTVLHDQVLDLKTGYMRLVRANNKK